MGKESTSMRNADAYELLTAVIADLKWVTDRLLEDPDGETVACLLAQATTRTDEFSLQVAGVNAAIARTIRSMGD